MFKISCEKGCQTPGINLVLGQIYLVIHLRLLKSSMQILWIKRLKEIQLSIGGSCEKKIT